MKQTVTKSQLEQRPGATQTGRSWRPRQEPGGKQSRANPRRLKPGARPIAKKSELRTKPIANGAGNENAPGAAFGILILRPDPGHDAEKEHPVAIALRARGGRSMSLLLIIIGAGLSSGPGGGYYGYRGGYYGGGGFGGIGLIVLIIVLVLLFRGGRF